MCLDGANKETDTIHPNKYKVKEFDYNNKEGRFCMHAHVCKPRMAFDIIIIFWNII